MDLIVNSDRARDLAETLAERMGKSVSEAVETALEEKLAATPLPPSRKLTPEEKMEKMRRIEEILARSGPTPPGATSDHSDLYDEDGLPA